MLLKSLKINSIKKLPKLSFSSLTTIENERKLTLSKIYLGKFDNLSQSQKIQLAHSGDLWWNYHKLGNRVISLSDSTYSLLKNLDNSSKELCHHDPFIDNNSPVWKAFRLSLTHHSTSIEGNKLTRDQVEKVLDEFGEGIALGVGISELDIDGSSQESPHDIAEVVNHASAMEFIKKKWMIQKREGIVITIKDMEDLFKILMPDPNSSSFLMDTKYLPENQGCFRRTPIKIRGSPTVRPYPHEVVSLLNKIIQLRFVQHADIHPIVADILFMMNFLFIHPYPDGNGRISRLIFQILLYHNGYFGCIIPKEDRSLFFSHFTPYFENGKMDGVVSYLANRIQHFHEELDSFEKKKVISPTFC